MQHNANIVGKVEYRQGDGPSLVIRRGPVEIETTQSDATLSWTDGDTHGAVAMPLTDYKRYVDEGAIQLDS